MQPKPHFSPLYAVCIILVLFVTACQGSADHDIRGEWDYVMIAADGNTYDAGTITFSGTATRGTFSEVNIYDVTYEGEYRVSGSRVTLSGDENWEGAFSAADMLSGTWQHDDGTNGTWTATRQTP